MNKRLRKKKRLGEFKELAFELRADLRPGLVGVEPARRLVRLGLSLGSMWTVSLIPSSKYVFDVLPRCAARA